MRRIKGRSRPALCYMVEEKRAFVPSGIVFFKHLNGNNLGDYECSYV